MPNGNSSQNYGASPANWDYTLHGVTYQPTQVNNPPPLTPARQADIDLLIINPMS